MQNKVTEVGVGILVFRNEGKEILLGLRKKDLGYGTWETPGGRVDFGEDPLEAAKRELKEETGLDCLKIEKGPWINSLFGEEGPHFISILTKTSNFSGHIETREPDKCDGWQWFPSDDLPQPLFLPLEKLIKQYKMKDLYSKKFE
jgi:8-oxo-dGTP diphosphatase